MPIAATVRYNQADSVNETVPRAITDAAEVAVVTNANVTHWWPGERGMMEGAQASAVVNKWKDNKALAALTPANLALPGLYGYDATIRKGYLKLGQGARSRVTNTMVDAKIQAGGSGYVVGEQITFQNGVVIQLTAVTSGAALFNSFTFLNYGTFASQPSAVLTQTSTTGSGTGATLNPEFKADNGSMLLSANVIPASGPFTVISAFRAPLVADVATSGGIIVGSQLTQGNLIASNANNRFWGLRVGHNVTPGKLTAHLNGDAIRVDDTAIADYRDGLWHVAMMMFNPGGVSQLWVDGVNSGSAIGGNSSGININTGGRYLRVGASGLPAIGPTLGASLDVGNVMVLPLDLTLSGNATLRQQILNMLLLQWRGGGTSA